MKIKVNNNQKIVVEPKGLTGNKFYVRYNTVRNVYIQNDGLGEVEVKDWKSLSHKYSKIQYKLENDWKMCYLTREEGSESAFIEWYFDFEKLKASGKNIAKFEILCQSACFESGEVNLGLTCIKTNETESELELDMSKINHQNSDLSYTWTNNQFSLSLINKDSLSGLKLRAKLSKGNGQHSWQHTQLFRQSLNDTDKYLFEVSFYFN